MKRDTNRIKCLKCHKVTSTQYDTCIWCGVSLPETVTLRKIIQAQPTEIEGIERRIIKIDTSTATAHSRQL